MSDSSQLIAFLQAHLKPFDDALRIISECAYIEFYLLFCAILFWCGCTVLAARLSCLTLFSTAILTGLKQFIFSSRPYMDYPELFNGWRENQWGMPSGHSQNAMVFWGAAAVSISSRLFRFVAILLIFTIGLSRLYLGVHYLSQVLVGFLLGMVIIVFSYRFETRFCRWITRLSSSRQLTLLFALVHLPCLLTFLVHVFLNIQPDESPSYQRLSFFSGLLFGIVISLLPMLSNKLSHHHGTIKKRLATKVFPGVISLYVIWQSKNYLSPFIQDLPHSFLQYLLFWLLGFFISLWACWIWPKIHQRLFK
ncbi:phosphatase PAP2 family protein [uncultured Endozoicomonas sp.]|uniref:phosphatase PAP2 family protein n=1 Tax=uncultured Endozoicomonas sp. TaxID=432652 RepID=UPI002639F665|nr:phosphatase PAP2 family protein [uncultured Endozoicomonas sp.]